MFNKFMMNTPYLKTLQKALETYKKTKSAIDASSEIDKEYYMELGNGITGLRIMHNESALIIKMDIDMKNLLLLIKAKRAGLKFTDISERIIGGGRMAAGELEQLYTSSKDIESMVSQIKIYDLKSALDVYRSSKRKQLLVFEIGMRNSIFNDSMRLLRHSILSFGAILAYSYMKEIELFTLRILIQGRVYGLSREEIERLIVWKNT